MPKYRFTAYLKSIFNLPLAELKNQGADTLIFDLDNTLLSYKENSFSKETVDFFKKLSADFRLYIFSNSGKSRQLLNALPATKVFFNLRKPFTKTGKKICRTEQIECQNSAFIGDQLLTDVVFSNKMQFKTTFLVKSIDSTSERFLTKINRFREKIIFAFIRFFKPNYFKRNLLRYYLNTNFKAKVKYLKKALKTKLDQDKERYLHSLSTAKMCRQLAKHWKIDENQAYLSGLIHDFAKHVNADEAHSLVKFSYPELKQTNSTNLLHGPVSAYLFSELIDLSEDQKNSVFMHTTPTPEISTLGKILFISDKAEVRRTFKDLGEIRKVMWQDLNKACVLVFEGVFKSLKSRGIKPEQIQIDTYNKLKQEIK